MDTIPEREESSTPETDREVEHHDEVQIEESAEDQTSNSLVATTIKTKRGPPVHSVWSNAFDDPNAYSKSKPNNTICKNCKQSVRHHHKVLSVKNHLKKCKQFRKLMLDTPVTDRPEWWNAETNKKKGTSSSLSSSTSSTTSLSTTAQPYAKSFAIPLFNALQQKNFNHKMALFFYNTGTSFSRIEDPFVLSAIQFARPQAKLPTRKQLADDSPGGLLQECYEEIKSKVDSFLSKHNHFMSITSDAWSNIANESVVNQYI